MAHGYRVVRARDRPEHRAIIEQTQPYKTGTRRGTNHPRPAAAPLGHRQTPDRAATLSALRCGYDVGNGGASGSQLAARAFA